MYSSPHPSQESQPPQESPQTPLSQPTPGPQGPQAFHMGPTHPVDISKQTSVNTTA
jgi:hypothetical protein